MKNIKSFQCKSNPKCSISKFENDECSVLDDEFPQLLEADGFYPGILLIRIDLVLQYVQRMGVQESFALASIDDRVLIIDIISKLKKELAILCDPHTEKWHKTDIVSRHVLDQMRYDS